MVWPCSENGRRKITQNSTEVNVEIKESTRKTEETLMEGIRKDMNERNLNEGQWEERKQWRLGVRQCGKSFETDIYIIVSGPCRLR
jgi:hypothetical protein